MRFNPNFREFDFFGDPPVYSLSLSPNCDGNFGRLVFTLKRILLDGPVNSLIVLFAGMTKSQSWTGTPPLQQATRSSSTASSPQKQLPRYSNVVKSSSDYGIPNANSNRSSAGNGPDC